MCTEIQAHEIPILSVIFGVLVRMQGQLVSAGSRTGGNRPDGRLKWEKERHWKLKKRGFHSHLVSGREKRTETGMGLFVC